MKTLILATIALSVMGLPYQASAHLSPSALTPTGDVQLTVTTGPKTPAGSFALWLQGTGMGTTHAVPLELRVIGPPPAQPCETDGLEPNGYRPLAYPLQVQGDGDPLRLPAIREWDRIRKRGLGKCNRCCEGEGRNHCNAEPHELHELPFIGSGFV